MTLNDLPPSPFCENLGIEVLEATGDRSVTRVEVTDAHANSLGIAHGGLIFTLADRAFGAAENRLEGRFVSMDMHVRYLRPAQVGQRLTATAQCLHKGRQTSFYQIEVRNETNRLIACLTATGHLFGPPK